MDAYELAILLVGLALLGAAWVPHLVERNVLTFPILYVALGALVYTLPLPLPAADPTRAMCRCVAPAKAAKTRSVSP